MTALPSYLVALQALVGGEARAADRYNPAHLRVTIGPFLFNQYGGRSARAVAARRVNPADKRPREHLDFRLANLDDTAKVTAPALAAAMGRAIARWADDRTDMVAQALAVAPAPIAAGIRAELAVIRAEILARHAAELAALDAIATFEETP